MNRIPITNSFWIQKLGLKTAGVYKYKKIKKNFKKLKKIKKLIKIQLSIQDRFFVHKRTKHEKNNGEKLVYVNFVNNLYFVVNLRIFQINITWL